LSRRGNRATIRSKDSGTAFGQPAATAPACQSTGTLTYKEASASMPTPARTPAPSPLPVAWLPVRGRQPTARADLHTRARPSAAAPGAECKISHTRGASRSWTQNIRNSLCLAGGQGTECPHRGYLPPKGRAVVLQRCQDFLRFAGLRYLLNVVEQGK
jgi:hypothetical protein